MTGFLSLVALHRQPLLSIGVILHLKQLLQLLVRRLQLVIVEEAHQVPLPWLQSELIGERADSELLDDLEDVDFTIELLKCVLLQKLLPFFPLSAATAVPLVKQLKAIAAPVSVGERLPLGDGLL